MVVAGSLYFGVVVTIHRLWFWPAEEFSVGLCAVVVGSPWFVVVLGGCSPKL